jgi:dCMP deaminase
MKHADKIMFMEFAEAAARRSHAVRRKVGCVLVKDGEVLSTGLNGMPPKWPTEVCEDKVYMDCDYPMWSCAQEIVEEFPFVDGAGRYKLITKPECRHAEIASLEKMWNSHNTTKGADCFVTTSPCKNCSIKLLTAGIKSVYYREQYTDTSGLDYLKANNVIVEQI